MFNFNPQFFERNQKRLLKIANSKWLHWLLGLNRLPKEIKGLKIDRITPNSIHHNLEIKLTKNGRHKKQKVKAFFFTRPRFAEALAYNLSPFCYFQELRSPKFSWRFSPVGLTYILLFGLIGKLAGLPLAFMATITPYTAGAGDGYVSGPNDSADWDTDHDALSGTASNPDSNLFCGTGLVGGNYFINRGFLPFDTSSITDTAIITAATLNLYITLTADSDNDGEDWVTVVQTTQANPNGNLVNGDFDTCGTVNTPTEGIDTGERKDISSVSTSAWLTFNLNSTGLSWIDKVNALTTNDNTKGTRLGVREGHDVLDHAYAGANGTYNYIYGYHAAHTGTDFDPYLSVTYFLGFQNAANAYSSNNIYAEVDPAISGVLSVQLSKNAGSSYTTALTKTFTSTEEYLTYGDGSTELWGTTWTGDDIDDTSFRLKVSHNGITQVYKTFGFAITASRVLTGIEVAVEAKYISGDAKIYIDHIKVKIYYGTSILPVQAGSLAYASDGRKAGEGAGVGTGVLVFYDGAAKWIAVDSGTEVAA